MRALGWNVLGELAQKVQRREDLEIPLGPGYDAVSIRVGKARQDYMSRCPFSVSRLVKVTETGHVIYKAEKPETGRPSDWGIAPPRVFCSRPISKSSPDKEATT
jgi:hypothetical protein